MNGKQGQEKNEVDDKHVHLFWKKIGETPLESIFRFKREKPEFSQLRMTYAGRLDPMAEGLLILLSGDMVNEKEKYLSLRKTYEFEILWGFSTDSLDILGIAEENNNTKPSEEEIRMTLFKMIGKFEQSYPAYSSRPVNGKSLLNWAREGRLNEIDIPKHEVELFTAEYVERKTISKSELRKNLEYKIALVNGDFRQKEVVTKWIEVLDNSKENEFIIDKFITEVSSGFYIRQFVSDFSEALSSSGTTFSIKRSKIGEYSL